MFTRSIKQFTSFLKVIQMIRCLNQGLPLPLPDIEREQDGVAVAIADLIEHIVILIYNRRPVVFLGRVFIVGLTGIDGCTRREFQDIHHPDIVKQQQIFVLIRLEILQIILLANLIISLGINGIQTFIRQKIGNAAAINEEILHFITNAVFFENLFYRADKHFGEKIDAGGRMLILQPHVVIFV